MSNNRLNFEYIFNYFKDQGCELLETNYINNRIKMKYKCLCGKISEIAYGNFQQGQRCKSCGINKNSKNKYLKYDYVYNYFKEQSCELLATEYIGVHIKMKYICDCGNTSKINFANFQQGKRCLECSGKKKLTIEYINKKFIENNYILLETEYINAHTKMKYKCDNNHISKINWNSFNNGSRCRKCYFNNNRKDNHPNWKNDRTRKIRLNYLKFDHRKINILKDDPLYEKNIISRKDAKLNDKKWDITEYTIDHIFPRVAFIDNNLDKIYEPYIMKEICNSRDNLRIILKEENGSKGGKYDREEFINWINKKLEEYNVKNSTIFIEEITSGKF